MPPGSADSKSGTEFCYSVTQITSARDSTPCDLSRLDKENVYDMILSGMTLDTIVYDNTVAKLGLVYDPKFPAVGV